MTDKADMSCEFCNGSTSEYLIVVSVFQPGFTFTICSWSCLYRWAEEVAFP